MQEARFGFDVSLVLNACTSVLQVVLTCLPGTYFARKVSAGLCRGGWRAASGVTQSWRHSSRVVAGQRGTRDCPGRPGRAGDTGLQQQARTLLAVRGLLLLAGGADCACALVLLLLPPLLAAPRARSLLRPARAAGHRGCARAPEPLLPRPELDAASGVHHEHRSPGHRLHCAQLLAHRSQHHHQVRPPVTPARSQAGTHARTPAVAFDSQCSACRAAHDCSQAHTMCCPALACLQHGHGRPHRAGGGLRFQHAQAPAIPCRRCLRLWSAAPTTTLLRSTAQSKLP